jgi:DNA topoisomerase-1
MTADSPDSASYLLDPPLDDPRQSAEEAGLRYTTDSEAGFTRRKEGDEFRYYTNGGEPVGDEKLLARFAALAIPPAWTEVWICKRKNGHLQVTGRDEKGRKQYIYHPEWDAARNRTKFTRILAFAARLPELRERVEQDIRRRGYPREKVLAIMVLLLEKTLIRIGNPEYVRNNQSYGLSTLEDDHFHLEGQTLNFTFTGKSGKAHEISLRDRRLGKKIAELQELPGQHLFQYIDEQGQPMAVGSHDVNQYLREITGEAFSAKDFRTWGGTVLAAVELYGLGPAETKTERKRKLVAGVKGVAGLLGNTVTVCRQYYIHPEVFAAYEDGRLFDAFQRAALEADARPAGLGLEEQAVIYLLQSSSMAEPTA